MIKTARNGIHWTRTHFGLQFTLKGVMELTRTERGMIEAALFTGKLGESYTFPDDEQIWEFTPEGINEPTQEVELEAHEAEGDDAEALLYAADRYLDEGRDDAALGVDSAAAQIYRRLRGRI